MCVLQLSHLIQFNLIINSLNPLICVSSTYQTTNMPPKALVILSEGAEEMETVISVDVMRRAGIDVTIAGLSGSQPVKCSRDVFITPDVSLSDINGDFDIIVCPGGLAGSNAMANSPEVGQLLKQQEKSGKLIATICAAGIVLKSHGIGIGKRITSHPSKAEELKESYQYSEERVVIDGQLITSRSPGTAFEFALAIVEKLVGKEKANELSVAMMLK